MSQKSREELNEEARSVGVLGAENLPNAKAVEDAIEAALEATQPNPALAPEPVDETVERNYEVVGPRAVAGHSKGEKFKATYTSQQEAALIEGGHIKRVREA